MIIRQLEKVERASLRADSTDSLEGLVGETYLKREQLSLHAGRGRGVGNIENSRFLVKHVSFMYLLKN